jgi:hypothetical protein
MLPCRAVTGRIQTFDGAAWGDALPKFYHVISASIAVENVTFPPIDCLPADELAHRHRSHRLILTGFGRHAAEVRMRMNWRMPRAGVQTSGPRISGGRLLLSGRRRSAQFQLRV